jgi:hypothetical protein
MEQDGCEVRLRRRGRIDGPGHEQHEWPGKHAECQSLEQEGRGQDWAQYHKQGSHRKVPTAKCTTQPSPIDVSTIPLATWTESEAWVTPVSAVRKTAP